MCGRELAEMAAENVQPRMCGRKSAENVDFYAKQNENVAQNEFGQLPFGGLKVVGRKWRPKMAKRAAERAAENVAFYVKIRS